MCTKCKLKNLIPHQNHHSQYVNKVLRDNNFIEGQFNQHLSKNLISAPKNNDALTVDELFLIDESLSEPLLTIADKCLGRLNLSFEQLTLSEQKLWKLFEMADIY
jgi:hypothetical protein